MLKRFFISMLGTVAGVFISGMLAVFIIVALVGTIAGKSLGEKSGIKEHSILHLKLDGVLTERIQTPDIMDIVQGDGVSTLSLEELRNALSIAADDKKIDGVFIDCGSFSAGPARNSSNV